MKKVSIMNAFGVISSGGNPAGVVYNQNDLSKDEKQFIAKEVNVSETVFINKINDIEFEVEFYTPNKEVDLCGHGTIAAFQYLINKNIISKGTYYQITKAGKLEMHIDNDKRIYMEQKKPEFYEIIEDRDLIAKSLNITKDDLIDYLPIEIVSTGLKDILIGVKNNKILNNIKPDFSLIYNISKENEVVGYHIYSLEKNGNETANCRNFAPFYEIDEESATGTSSGALASFLFKYNILKENEYNDISFLQGEAMNELSKINVELSVKNNKIEKVYVGGNATFDKEINMIINKKQKEKYEKDNY